MKLDRIIQWVDETLDAHSFDDVANNGLQLSRDGDEIAKVAFAVDASVRSVKAAAAIGAQLLIAHHGISWGGGIRRIVDGEYNVIRAAMNANLAIAAYHLPLDANRRCGNNYEIARTMKLKRLQPAFSYHGNVIGVIGYDRRGRKIGICSGGAGEFAVEAKRLGCVQFITGEASWGDVIAAENVDMEMITAGHYETEIYGVTALAKLMKRVLHLQTDFVGDR